MARRRPREWTTYDVMQIAGSIAALAVLWQMAHPEPPKPKTFTLHVDGSYHLPVILEVWGAGQSGRQEIRGTIPRDYTFHAKGAETITVRASRPSDWKYGVIELTLSKDGKVISKGETRPPRNLASVQGS